MGICDSKAGEDGFKDASGFEHKLGADKFLFQGKEEKNDAWEVASKADVEALDFTGFKAPSEVKVFHLADGSFTVAENKAVVAETSADAKFALFKKKAKEAPKTAAPAASTEQTEEEKAAAAKAAEEKAKQEAEGTT